ncbi:hypothetical protein Misp01_58610 [Microtetraspora sp. NBRC 13810]|uniref:glycerol dehydratase reactivase beta/small subunit family protein n=1 Tax=Microtetraspora sp. NBRC 13810 TaxID=3030990 RepID=UPI0024A1C473|nr:glycerol dehydratase reactivase beta/small subunit family protein [Microtetraspora sp. NBRC 13810]GLW10733.1 hypothetical protein Misp01_58610 [Microtetraspora sp. NBRC 13810]
MRCTSPGDRPAGRAGRIPPAVVLLHRHGDPRVLREILAGLEEEGVPCRTEEAADGGARELAFAAAQVSSLGVGVGVDAMGNTCVHHAKLPRDAPAAAGPAGSARVMGHNAARLVVRIPFKRQEDSHA